MLTSRMVFCRKKRLYKRIRYMFLREYFRIDTVGRKGFLGCPSDDGDTAV